MGVEAMVGFGYKQAWLAVADGDPTAVATALGLRGLGEVSWRHGVDLSYLTDDRLVVTPPLPGAGNTAWTLVTGRWLLRRDRPGLDLAALSEEFGTEVQFFASHRVVDLHTWRRAVKGVSRREFGYLGESGQVTLWRGEPDVVELAVGLPAVRPPDDPEEGPFLLVGEADVMRVAGAWSVDPTGLDGRPAPGPLRMYAVG